MINSLTSSLSGLHAAEKQISAISHNIANAGTKDFKAVNVDLKSSKLGNVIANFTQSDESVDLSKELVKLSNAETNFLSNLKAIEVAKEIEGSLVDILV